MLSCGILQVHPIETLPLLLILLITIAISLNTIALLELQQELLLVVIQDLLIDIGCHQTLHQPYNIKVVLKFMLPPFELLIDTFNFLVLSLESFLETFTSTAHEGPVKVEHYIIFPVHFKLSTAQN